MTSTALIRACRQTRREVVVTQMRGERLSPAQKALIVGEVLIAYARARRYMARRDIRGAVESIRRRSSPSPTWLAPESEEAWRVSFRLAMATRRTLGILPCDARCLAQSLVVCQLLSARAIPFTLVIGVNTDPEFAAHAWVELDGRPVLPPREFAETRLVEI